MNQDYVTQLRLQLREAALREERRAPLARRVVRARRGLPGPAPLAAALAAALLAVAVVIGALQLRGEPEPVKPKVIHTFTVSNGLSSIASGFGAVWAADPITSEILRIDPETRNVAARIRSTGEVQVAAGAGGVWVLGGDLLTSGAQRPVVLSRIDPRTNRIVARIPMRSPDGDNFAPLFMDVDDEHVWVCGAGGALRIDPATNAPDRFVAFGPASAPVSGRPATEPSTEAISVVAEGERVWLLLPGGRLRELDARTGKVVADVRIRGIDNANLGPGAPGTLTISDGNRLSSIDTAGRELWRASLGDRVGAWLPDGDALWAHVSGAPSAGDQLVRLDADNGRSTGRVELSGFEVAGMAKVGRDVWVATPGGGISVVR